MKGLRLAEITWEEARDAVADYPVAVLPIGGGTKEHGPHLPLGTDLMVVQELANRVLKSVPIMLLPTLSYAYYPAFTEWPGSVSIEAQHFINFVSDIIRSLHRYGTKKFLILDGGVSTHPPMDILSRDLYNELGVQVAVTNILGLGKEVRLEIAEQERGGHADEIETSRMLIIRPDLVKMERTVKEYNPIVPGTFAPTGIKKIHIGGKMRTENGINGDSTLATAAKGEQSLQAMAQDIITFLEYFISTTI